MGSSEVGFFELNSLVRNRIDELLASFFADKRMSAAKIDPRFKALIEHTESVARRGGKRLRSTLAVVGYEAMGGKNRDYAVKVAMAIELLHIFMLVHDDIMDQDLMRHGGKNLGGIYRRKFKNSLQPEQSSHLADSMAILGGDILLTWVYEVLAKTVEDGRTVSQLIQLVSEVTFDTVAGQQLDVLSATSSQASMRYTLKIPYYKTGLYSFVAPLQFGAVLAGADKQDVFKEYGANLGIAFQLIDDDLGMFGSTRQTGKPVQSDLEENKATLLRYYGYALANDSQKAILSSLLGRKGLSLSDVRLARSVLEDCGARAKCLVVAQRYGEKAKQAISQPDSQLDQLTQKRLLELAEFCLKRKH